MDYMKEFVELSQEQANTFIRDSINWEIRNHIRDRIDKTATVLDVGCGNGNDAKRYNPDLYRGIDISPPLINAARKYCPKHTFAVGDASNTSFEDDSFEYVFCVSVLEHLHSLKDTRDILREMVRVSSKKVLISWHNPPLDNEPTKILSWVDKTGRHFGYKKWSNYFNTDELIAGIVDRDKINVTKYNSKLVLWEIDISV